jgi:hypothetical protein
MEKCGYRSVIACSAPRYFCSIDVNLTMPALVDRQNPALTTGPACRRWVPRRCQKMLSPRRAEGSNPSSASGDII